LESIIKLRILDVEDVADMPIIFEKNVAQLVDTQIQNYAAIIGVGRD
jgi:hypothetical protein